MFTLGFVALAYDIVMALLPPAQQRDYLWQMPILAILVVVYFRFLFGYLSRAFERQADVYAAGLVGTPVPLILALEKIALMSGDIRNLRSWRHHSVDQRVRYLGEVGYDPAKQSAYHRGMRIVSGLVATSVVLFSAWASYLWMHEPEGIDEKIRNLETIVHQDPTKYQAWTRLGRFKAEADKAEGALHCFGEALRNHPRHKEALDGLNALDVPDDAKHRTLAVAFAGAGYLPQAKEHADAAIEKGPDDALNWIALARVRIAAGEAELAKEALRKALELAPQNEEAKKLLASLEPPADQEEPDAATEN